MVRLSTRSVPLAAVFASVVMLLGACGSGDGSADAGTGAGGANNGQVRINEGGDPNPGPADVEIHNFRYEDDTFTVSAGSSVQWVNEGSAPHTVTGDNFDSGTIRKGNGFAHQFDEPGEYEYWCKNHESMRGTIVVE